MGLEQQTGEINRIHNQQTKMWEDKVVFLQKARDVLQAENKLLKAYTHHKEGCPAMRMFYIRECPHCESRKNHWQTGGPGFEHYRVCEECDGPAYIPEERLGECTCGLDQALNNK